MKTTRNKLSISVALNRHLLDKAKKVTDTGEFGSVSDVIQHALTKFFCEYDSEKTLEQIVKERTPELVQQLHTSRFSVFNICGRIIMAQDLRKQLNIPEPSE